MKISDLFGSKTLFRGSLIAVLMTLATIGCHSTSEYLSEGNLVLSAQVIDPPTSTGAPIVVKYTLVNAGSRTIRACFSNAHSELRGGINLISKMDGREYGGIHVIDHPQCVQRFQLEPRARLEWIDTFELGPIPEGPAKFSAWTEVTSPEWCGSRGCRPLKVTAFFREVLLSK